MSRIYVIVPKKIATKPVMKVTAGYALAQVHHASVKATYSFQLSENSTVIVLQVANRAALVKTGKALQLEGVRHVLYSDEVTNRGGQYALTALVTAEVPRQPKCLRRKRLWK